MVEVVLQRSSNKDKKYSATIDGKKTINFGQKGYSDFTINKDEKRKHNYIARHEVNQDWKDYKTAGFYAKNILWNKPTIEASVKDMQKKFKNSKIKKKLSSV